MSIWAIHIDEYFSDKDIQGTGEELHNRLITDDNIRIQSTQSRIRYILPTQKQSTPLTNSPSNQSRHETTDIKLYRHDNISTTIVETPKATLPRFDSQPFKQC